MVADDSAEAVAVWTAEAGSAVGELMSAAEDVADCVDGAEWAGAGGVDYWVGEAGYCCGAGG